MRFDLLISTISNPPWDSRRKLLDVKVEEGKQEFNILRMGKYNGIISSEGSSSGREWRTQVGVTAAGLILPIMFPVGHMLLFSLIWGSITVDTKECTNSCWDTVFKGPYENGRVSRYKNVYFNATLNTGKMWLITVLGVISLYETFKRLTLLALKGRLRYTMAVLVISSLHSHYYAWWGHWNHWNDDFYLLWNHQLFFTITELVSTIAVLANADGNTAIKPLSLILVANIALFHILSSGLDQFVKNVVAFQGSLHQVLRDVFLMSTDILQLVIALYELDRLTEQRRILWLQLLRQKSHIWCVSITTLVMFLYITFFP